MQRAAKWLALTPATLILAVFFLGCLAWTFGLSFTSTRLIPRADFVGLQNYRVLLQDPRLAPAFAHLAAFGALFIGLTLLLGLLLALGLDALAGRARTLLQAIFLAPLALSWLVTGLLWQWILNPDLGLQRQLQALGWTTARVDWLVQPRTALLTLVIAASWHAAGMVMAVFLAGLATIPPDIRKTLQLENIPPWRGYLHVILPMLRTHTLTAALLLAFAVARTFDLVVAMTGGGPGFATEMPALLIYDLLFPRSRAGLAAACTIALVLTLVAALSPALFLLRRRPR